MCFTSVYVHTSIAESHHASAMINSQHILSDLTAIFACPIWRRRDVVVRRKFLNYTKANQNAIRVYRNMCTGEI
jgi:hypothetical protein